MTQNPERVAILRIATLGVSRAPCPLVLIEEMSVLSAGQEAEWIRFRF